MKKRPKDSLIHVAVVKDVLMFQRSAAAGGPFGSNDIGIFRVFTYCTGNLKSSRRVKQSFSESPTAVFDGPPQAELATPVLLTILGQQ